MKMFNRNAISAALKWPTVAGVFYCVFMAFWTSPVKADEMRDDPKVRLEAIIPSLDPTNTPAQLAQRLKLNQHQQNLLTAGCSGLTAALQGQTGIPLGVINGTTVYSPQTLPENYNNPATGTTTTPYPSQAAAHQAAADAEAAGSTAVEFRKDGGTPDANGNPTRINGGPFDYLTKVNVGGTTYYVDANHSAIPEPDPEKYYAKTTPPPEATIDNPRGVYTASKWYVTVTTPPKK